MSVEEVNKTNTPKTKVDLDVEVLVRSNVIELGKLNLLVDQVINLMLQQYPLGLVEKEQKHLINIDKNLRTVKVKLTTNID